MPQPVPEEPTPLPQSDPSRRLVWMITGALGVAFAGVIGQSVLLLCLGGLFLLAGLAMFGRAPVRLVFSLTVLLGFCLFRLWSDFTGSGSLGVRSVYEGLLWMLAGIWITPILIWPIGFIREFKRWLKP